MFLQRAGSDYAEPTIAAHFLLNCQSGLKLAQVARLVGGRDLPPRGKTRSLRDKWCARFNIDCPADPTESSSLAMLGPSPNFW